MPSVSRSFGASSASIHPTALVHPSAELGRDVEIGPYAIVERHVQIGDGTRVLAAAYIAAGTIIGTDCEIHMGAVLGHAPQIRGHAGPCGRLVIGDRNIIREYATLHRGRQPGGDTVVGSDNFLLGGCHVGHDCRIGDRTTIANGALLAGFVRIGDGAFISGHVGIHQHVKVGALSLIRGMTGVTKDVLPFVIVAGISELAGINVIGMRRAGMSAAQRLNVQRAYAVLFRSGLNLSQALARLHAMPANAERDAWLAFAADSTRGLCMPRRSRRYGPHCSDQSEV